MFGFLSCTNNPSPEVNRNEQQDLVKGDLEFEAEPIIGERIDGPANLRDAIKGKVILSVEDNQLVECAELKDGWYPVGLMVPINQEQYDNGIIKKGEKIFHKDELICTTLEDVDLWMTYEDDDKDATIKYTGLLGGYTYKNNIKANSIPELELEKILNAGKELRKEAFEWYLKNFNFEKHGLKIEHYEHVEQYMIYDTFIDDPSPIDRIRLIFDSNKLIAVIHKRELKMKNKLSYDLDRRLKILVIKEFKKADLDKFITNNKKSYWGVD